MIKYSEMNASKEESLPETKRLTEKVVGEMDSEPKQNRYIKYIRTAVLILSFTAYVSYKSSF